ncbi:MAG TPA: hypothetical protein VFJ90_13920, partial [Candidatus Didemnitutus sp.]|nr:hypothetical protein [Candidatus Didemnitutus sp.]
SLTRGRLMYFGPADRDENLLLAPPTMENRNMLGGHRLWLGPQATWLKGWPPPKEWEYSGPESWTTDNGVLRMLAGDAGDGWPRLTRVYRWNGPSLVCGAEFSGGTRDAQFVQIFQMPAETAVSADASPEKEFPAGYVQLPSTAGPFAAQFVPPPHVTRTAGSVILRHVNAVGKFGFRPQTLVGAAQHYVLKVSRGAQNGEVVSNPDQGFLTQVYLSGPDGRFIELEQLSPVFAAGRSASFDVTLAGAAR